jgi:hypothetical protein
MILTIRHYGHAFHNNANAVLLFTGIRHHVILLKV